MESREILMLRQAEIAQSTLDIANELLKLDDLDPVYKTILKRQRAATKRLLNIQQGAQIQWNADKHAKMLFLEMGDLLKEEDFSGITIRAKSDILETRKMIKKINEKFDVLTLN